METRYDFKIVGGPWDGLRGLKWIESDEAPLPEVIFIGLCAEGRLCPLVGCSEQLCHPSYWSDGEDDRPMSVVEYSLESKTVDPSRTCVNCAAAAERCRCPAATMNLVETGVRKGSAIYAVGGLLDPRNFGALARVPVASGSGYSRRSVPWGPAPELAPTGLFPHEIMRLITDRYLPRRP